MVMMCWWYFKCPFLDITPFPLQCAQEKMTGYYVVRFYLS